MSDTTEAQPIHEARVFTSREDAMTFLQSIPDPLTIIIITPPPH